MLPTFVIIGAQKSASTFVQECLREHPDIFMPVGETSFFETPDFEHQSPRDLELLFQGRSEPQRGIKRPAYLGKPEVPPRIETHVPEAKLIAILRNPVERAVSAYYHYIRDGFIPPRSIETGMREIIEGTYKNVFKRSGEILEFGLYYKYLSMYRYFLDRNAMLTLLHEDIVRAPQKTVATIYDYLGVSTEFRAHALSRRPQAVVYSIPRLVFLCARNGLRYTYNADRTRVYSKKRGVPARMLCSVITAFDTHVLAKLFPSRKPAVSADLLSRLRDFYREDVHKLESLIGRDCRNWLE